MDDLDRRILGELINDARKPLSRVAKAVDAAETTVYQRVKRMEQRGVIRGARLAVDWDEAGLGVVAIVSVELMQSGSLHEAADRFAEVPWVQNCFAITGEFDLLLVVRAHSSAHLGEVLEEIRTAVPGRTRTVVVLSTFFEGRIPQIGEG